MFNGGLIGQVLKPEALPKLSGMRASSITFSPRDLAQALGVSESSVRRWVDRGEIPSLRTEGGHRRIELASAVSYIRKKGLRVAEPELLGLRQGLRGSSSAPDALHAALEAGQEGQAWDIVVQLFLDGTRVAQIGDEWIRPAMQRIGELWTGGEAGILIEHRATGICSSILSRMQTLFAEPTGPIAVGGAPSGDPYTLPSKLSSLVLRAAGFQAVDLGPSTPLNVLAEAARELEARLVWLSVSAPLKEPSDRRALSAWLELLAGEGRTLVLGGRGIQSLELPVLEGVHPVQRASELHALALGMAWADRAG